MFRSPSADVMLHMFKAMHWPADAGTLTWDASATLVLVVFGLVAGHAISWLANRKLEFQGSWAFWPTLVIMTTFALAFGCATSGFIYFQF